jgi:hypothetical protein
VNDLHGTTKTFWQTIIRDVSKVDFAPYPWKLFCIIRSMDLMAQSLFFAALCQNYLDGQF